MDCYGEAVNNRMTSSTEREIQLHQLRTSQNALTHAIKFIPKNFISTAAKKSCLITKTAWRNKNSSDKS